MHITYCFDLSLTFLLGHKKDSLHFVQWMTSSELPCSISVDVNMAANKTFKCHHRI